jgi:hypothetical protein
MSHNIGPLAGRTVQDLGHHSTSRSDGSFCSSNMLIENSRSTTVKHLPPDLNEAGHDGFVGLDHLDVQKSHPTLINPT